MVLPDSITDNKLRLTSSGTGGNLCSMCRPYLQLVRERWLRHCHWDYADVCAQKESSKQHFSSIELSKLEQDPQNSCCQSSPYYREYCYIAVNYLHRVIYMWIARGPPLPAKLGFLFYIVSDYPTNIFHTDNCAHYTVLSPAILAALLLFILAIWLYIP